VSWDLPVREKCPVCGGNMVFKRGAKDKQYHLCTNESCHHRVEITG
jgi:Topoisomerase DNA binding C4 zinc finger.